MPALVRDHHGRLQACCLGGLLLLLPFEPRRPTFELAGFQLTLLEVAAALCAAGLAAALWRAGAAGCCGGRRCRCCCSAPTPQPTCCPRSSHLTTRWRRSSSRCAWWPWPASPWRWPRRAPARAARASPRLAAAGALVAALGARWRASACARLDPWLARFREMPFNVAGSRRASAGSEYPNLAAAFVMYGLLAAVPRLAAGRGRIRRGRLRAARCRRPALDLFARRAGRRALRAAGSGGRRSVCARRAARAADLRRAGVLGVAPRSPSRGGARSSACGWAARGLAPGTRRDYEPSEASLTLPPARSARRSCA